MDPIQKLISGADPLRDDTAEVPDADAALRGALAGPPVFSDGLPANVVPFVERRRSRARLAGVLGLAAAAVTAGVLVGTNLGALTLAPAPAGPAAPTASEATPTVSPTPAASRTAAAPAPTQAAPAGAWVFFTDATGQATFEHPDGWTVKEDPQTIAGGSYNAVEVRNSGGKTVATLTLAYDGTGGPMCPDPKPFQTLDSVVLDIPQKAAKLREFPRGPSAFVFRVIQGEKVYGSMALTDGELAPQPTTCGLYNGILGPDNVPFAHFGDSVWLTADGQNAPLTFDTVAAAKAHMQTQEYQDIKRMLVSLALRPAGTAPARG